MLLHFCAQCAVVESLTCSENTSRQIERRQPTPSTPIYSVLQYSHEGEFMEEYVSIAEASRVSKEPEHRIRTLCQGKTNSKALFNWKFKNDDETAEYSLKYSLK